MVLYSVANEVGAPRLGITASRKVGPAVVRQRVKRRIREIYRRWERRPELPSLDLMFHVKPSARNAAFSDLKRELLRLLTGVLPKRASSAG